MKTESKKSLAYFLKILTLLKSEGVDVRKIHIYVDGKRQITRLKDIKQEGIDVNAIIEKYDLDGEYRLGRKLHDLRQAYAGSGTCVLSEEGRKEAETLGVVTKFFVVEDVIEVLKILKFEGVDIRKINLDKNAKTERRSIVLRDISQVGIDIDAIIKKYNLDPNYPIGHRIRDLRQAYTGSMSCVITEENKKDAEELGILERKDRIEEVLDILEILQSEGVDVRRISVAKHIDGKTIPTILADLRQDDVNMRGIIEKHKLDKNFIIGLYITRLRRKHKFNREELSEETIKRINALGILEKKKVKELEAEQQNLLKQLKEAKKLKRQAQLLSKRKNMNMTR